LHLLVTGSAGFVGQNLVPYLRENQIRVSTLDQRLSLGLDASHTPYRLGSFEINLSKLLEDVDCVIHLASESHVDRSIEGPRVFVENNVLGTLELFEAAKEHKNLKIVLFSTDEVGACLPEGDLKEEYRFRTGSVYSATKGAQELLAQAFLKTHDLSIITTRCVNIFGPHQSEEKFIPMICKNALQDQPIPIYGNGMQTRQWVSVDHVCEFLNIVATSNYIPPGTLLHITGTKEIHNELLARTILGLLRKPSSLIHHVRDRAGHDARYALGRTEETDRWGVPQYEEECFMRDLEKTVEYYRNAIGS
jgi:dTDP-glucose 4,6-dehydratase